jgi:hypothetical protein
MKQMTLLDRFRSEPYYSLIMVWADKFEKADMIKRQAYKQSHLYRNSDIMDKRMEKVWNAVTQYEVIPTFINGELTAGASGLLKMAKLSKVFKK